jgi:hypothetical protein
VTGVQADYANHADIVLLGGHGKVIDDTAAATGLAEGILANGDADTVQSDHALNNAWIGIYDIGPEGKVLDNITDGNEGDGMVVAIAERTTVAGNVANFDAEYGIDAEVPVIDGGSNTATGNGKSEQCYGVVCAP